MRVVRVTLENEREFGETIRALEAHAIYPLGNDRFRLDHGPDYFAFFRRLGQLRTYAAVIDGRVACVASGVIRSARQADGRLVRAWYLCDLKVAPGFHGRHLHARLFGRVFLFNYLRCSRVFAVTMNRGGGRPNGVVRILERLPWIPLRLVGELVFYVWSESELQDVVRWMSEEIGMCRFRSLSGIKDLILESSGQTWPLYHIEGRHCLLGIEGGEVALCPVPGAAHMLCLPRGSELDKRLKSEGCRNIASASIVAHNMNAVDWSFLSSSEI